MLSLQGGSDDIASNGRNAFDQQCIADPGLEAKQIGKPIKKT